MSIKYMDLKDFVDQGYLQEANRRFFHPLGLALEMIVDDDGAPRLGGIWDYREDPEGILFEINDVERQAEMLRKADLFMFEKIARGARRKEHLGFVVQDLAFTLPATKGPSLEEPCPNTPDGRHSLYIGGPGGKRDRSQKGTVCESCGGFDPRSLLVEEVSHPTVGKEKNDEE